METPRTLLQKLWKWVTAKSIQPTNHHVESATFTVGMHKYQVAVSTTVTVGRSLNRKRKVTFLDLENSNFRLFSVQLNKKLNLPSRLPTKRRKRWQWK